MQGCFPFRMCLECVQGPSFSATQSYAHLRDEVHCVKLDTGHMGADVVLLKNNTRICGSGGTLANAPIVQNKAFFQVSVQQTGVWGIGLANRLADLTRTPIHANVWALRSDGTLAANGETIGQLDTSIKEGDTIGVAYDHVHLTFYKDRKPLTMTTRSADDAEASSVGPAAIAAPRNSQPLYPLVYVSDNAILDAKFRAIEADLPAGHEEIMIEQTLL